MFLEPNSEYIISLKASNEMGDGPPKYANVRTSVASQQEPALELTPPIGLKASILSPTSAVLYWSDTTLPQGQVSFLEDIIFMSLKFRGIEAYDGVMLSRHILRSHRQNSAGHT